MFNTLFEYFRGQGKPLPSVQQRRVDYGLGADYIGTAEQNQALLNRLQSQPSVVSSPVIPTNPQATDIQNQITGLQGKVKTAQGLGYAGNEQLQTDVAGNVIAKPTIPPAPPVTPAPESITGNNVLDALLDRIKGQESPLDIYKRLQEDLGIPAKQQAVAGIQGQVAKVEDLLNNLEADINTRIGGSFVTEAMRRRELAVSGAPLRTEYARLVRGQGLAEQGLTSARQQLSDLYSAQTKETPYQKLLGVITEEQAKQAIKPSAYTEVSPGATLYDPKTGKEIYRAPERPVKPPTSSDITEYEYAKKNQGYKGTLQDWLDRKQKEIPAKKDMTSYLDKQGIPLTVADTKGGLTKSALNKVVSAGVSLEMANFIWKNMQAGNNFEIIRAGMRAEGLDTALLDKFVQALQGTKKAGEGIINPFD